MSHMVIFRTPDGRPGYQPAETVAQAVEVVERLRNEEGVENVRIYRLEEVAFEYQPYYRVQLSDPDRSAELGRGADPVGEEPEPGEPQALAEPDLAEWEDAGPSSLRRGLFGR